MSVTTYTEEIAVRYIVRLLLFSILRYFIRQRVTADRRQEDEQCVGLNQQLQATTALVNQIKHRREEVRVRRDNYTSGIEKHAVSIPTFLGNRRPLIAVFECRKRSRRLEQERTNCPKARGTWQPTRLSGTKFWKRSARS
jgi:hypothetical protein